MGSPAWRKRRSGKTIAVGGGKGGVGKTLVAVNLAVAVSRMGIEVSLFDGDLGNSNCNTLLGITRVRKSLDHYLARECAFSEITMATAYPGLSLICGAPNSVGELLPDGMPRLLNELRRCKAECLILDLGAGVGEETLDLYRLAEEKIVVATPEVTSLQNAYGFVKSAFLLDLQRSGGWETYLEAAGSDVQKLHAMIEELEPRHPHRRMFAAVAARQNFGLLGNRVDDDKDERIIQNLRKVVAQYLRLESRVSGLIGTREEVRESVNRIIPFTALHPDSHPSREISRMAAALFPAGPSEGTAGI